MPYRADIGAYDAVDRLVLVVEVKALAGKTREWAASLRRNLFERGVARAPKYFLLALPDRFYLWKDPGAAREAVPADYEIDARAILDSYFKLGHLSPETIVSPALELIVSGWLYEVMSLDQLPPELSWLEESGLFQALKGGHVEYEVAA